MALRREDTKQYLRLSNGATIECGCQRVQAALGYTDTATAAGTERAHALAYSRT